MRTIMKKSEVGFSMVELTVAMAIIGTVATSVLMTNLYSKHQQILIKERTTIMAVLEKEMVLARTQGARNLTPGITSRETTLDQDGVAGTLTREVLAGRSERDRYVRVQLDWASEKSKIKDKHESFAAFLFSA